MQLRNQVKFLEKCTNNFLDFEEDKNQEIMCK